MARPIIIDDDDELPRPKSKEMHARESSREGYESGLASTLIGSVFLIIGMLAPIVHLVITRGRNDGYGNLRDESGFLAILLLFGFVGAEIICIIGVVFATRGMKHARADKSPVGMSVAGLMLCLAAMFLWILVGLGIVSEL